MIYINFDMPEEAAFLLPHAKVNDNNANAIYSEVRAIPPLGAADREGLNAFPVLGEQ